RRRRVPCPRGSYRGRARGGGRGRSRPRARRSTACRRSPTRRSRSPKRGAPSSRADAASWETDYPTLAGSRAGRGRKSAIGDGCTAQRDKPRLGNQELTGHGTLASSLLNTEIAGGRGQAALADCHGPPGADGGGGGPLPAALGWSRAGGSRVSCATPGCLFGLFSLLFMI